jgi:hypothetical protein
MGVISSLAALNHPVATYFLCELGGKSNGELEAEGK